MTEYKKIFVDTALFIYYLEKNPQYYDKARNFFEYCYKNEIAMVTSAVTVMEYEVYPEGNKDEESIGNFENMLDGLGIEVVCIDRIMAKKAAKIRAEFKGFKGMDAMQLASAIVSGCDAFLTNDKQLLQEKEICCVTLDEI